MDESEALQSGGSVEMMNLMLCSFTDAAFHLAYCLTKAFPLMAYNRPASWRLWRARGEEAAQCSNALTDVYVCVQWLFLLEGIPAIFLGIGILLYLAKSPEDAAFLRPEEKAWLIKRHASPYLLPVLF